MKEYFPVIDEEGNVVGKALRSECHNGSKILHVAVHLHLFNTKGELYLQKRADWKDIQPGKWDTSVGGHVDYGEEVESALLREAREELGLEGIRPKFLFRYIWESEVEREMIYVHYAVSDVEPKPDKNEVTEGRYWSIEEIENSLSKSVFTPNFEVDFAKLRETSVLNNILCYFK